jgi:hypothetical protein
VGVFRRGEPEESQGKEIAVQETSTSSVFINPVVSPAKSAAYNTPRTLTAAAAQVKVNDKAEFEQFRTRRAAASSAWQAEAWEYYDAIGEVKYAFNLVANVVSRIRMYAAVVEDPSEAPAPVSKSEKMDDRLAAAAERALKRLDSAYGGQAGLLKDAALNISVTGECYLVQMPARPGSGIPESWDIRSTDELITDARGGYAVIGRREQAMGNSTFGNGNGFAQALSSKAFVGRIWRNHPRFSDEADSSLRGLLDLCAELLLLNRTFRATARSRLNAGALYLPDGLSVAAQGDGDFPLDSDMDVNPSAFTVEEAEDEFEEQLIDAMTTPIRDEESASAVVPLIIRGPAELGDAIKQFKFERSFDPALAQRADRVLERILQGLDVPKDVVTGLANVKYSNALQIDEALYKAHIEPLMLLLVDSITVVYLRPYLIANGFSPDEVNDIVVWYDPSAVATRNDRAADADAGFDRMAVSFNSWRRAHGFSDADAPDGTEIALRMMMERGQVLPETTEAMLGAIAPDLMNRVREANQASSIAPVPPEVQQALDNATPTPGAEQSPEVEAAPEEGPSDAPAAGPEAVQPTQAPPDLFEPGQQ